MLLDRVRGELSLLQELHQPGATIQLTTGGLVQVGGEHGESFHVPVLGQGDLQRAGHRLHGLDLGSATNSGHRDTDVDSRTLVGVEQIRLQEDLTVGDGDDVRRDEGGHVVGLGLDDRKTGHRTAAQLVGQLRATLQQTGVEVEDVTGVSLATRRTTQQQ